LRVCGHFAALLHRIRSSGPAGTTPNGRFQAYFLLKTHPLLLIARQCYAGQGKRRFGDKGKG
jgi:hypothetical protein